MPTYSDNAKKLVTIRSMSEIFREVIPYPATSTDPAAWQQVGSVKPFTVYSGIQPTAQQVEANWTSYKSSNSNCLAHYTGAVFQFNSGTNTYYWTNTTSSITATALNSGTATWAIIWQNTPVDVSLTSIPSSGRFVVVPVTNTSGVGVIRYTNLVATQGEAFVPYDAGMTFNLA